MTLHTPFSKPYFDSHELNAVTEVLESGWITTGRFNHKLETYFKEKFKSKNAIAVTSATAGLHLMLMAIGIKPCDEIILIDDGSTDSSGELIKRLALDTSNHVVGVFLNRNYGQHSAIMAGFDQARGDFIITLDGNLQNPPEEIVNIISMAEKGFDVVGTIRQHRHDNFIRKMGSKFVNNLIQKITGKPMGDYRCMLRGYRQHIVKAMLLCHERSTFIPILANTFARKTIDIHAKHAPRLYGTSKYSFLKLIHLMFDLITCLTTTPLRILSLVGCLIASLGFIFALLLIILRITLEAQWGASGVFTLFAVLFFFIGCQFIAFGMLGEYIGRIYNDVRARPRYFIQAVIPQNSQ